MGVSLKATRAFHQQKRRTSAALLFESFARRRAMGLEPLWPLQVTDPDGSAHTLERPRHARERRLSGGRTGWED